MTTPIRIRRWVCTALLGAAALTATMASPPGPAAAPSVQTKVHAFDGHPVTLDVYPAAGPPRGAAILSHGFTRSRRTMAGHAQALAEAGVLVLTPNLPCTFDFRCNARALSSLLDALRAGGTFGALLEGVMLVGFSAGGLSSLLAADSPGVVGFVGLDPFDRTLPHEAERLGLSPGVWRHRPCAPRADASGLAERGRPLVAPSGPPVATRVTSAPTSRQAAGVSRPAASSDRRPGCGKRRLAVMA